MHKIKQGFNKTKSEYPELGYYIIACMVAKGKKYKSSEIGYLMKLVSDNDYTKSDKEELIAYLSDLTSRPV